MIKKLLICAFLSTSILAMEERAIETTEKKPSSTQEGALKAIVASYLDKLPIEIRKKIEDYLLFEKIPWEIKELIARSLVDSAANLDDAHQVGKDLRNLSQVNREFRNIVNSNSFTQYAINALIKKARLLIVEAALALGTPGAAQWLKEEQKVDPQLRWEMEHAGLLKREIALGNVAHAKLLIRAGVDLEGALGTAASLAADNDYLDMVKFLLTKNPSQDEKDYALFDALDGLSPVFNERFIEIKNNIVKLLINAGANVNTKLYSSYGSQGAISVLKLAKKRKLNEIAKMLEEAGAKEDDGEEL